MDERLHKYREKLYRIEAMRSGAQSAINAVGQCAFTFTQLNVRNQFSVGKETVNEMNNEIADSFLKNIKQRYV